MNKKICDVCDASLVKEFHGTKIEESGNLKASWGYMSNQDGTSYSVSLCETCFMGVISYLRENKRALNIFNEKYDHKDYDFGIDKEQSDF